MGLADVNRYYEENKENVDILVAEVLKLEKKIDIDKQKLKHYDFMAFKVNAFSKRYSQLSFILDAVYKKSRQYDFEPNLVLGIMQVESNFNPNAVSHVGACGLMQVNVPVWQKELAIDVNRIFEVAYNIDLGLQILKQYYIESNGNIKRALHLYNNGYLYNNTSYVDMVGSAVLSFNSNNANLSAHGYGQ